MANKSAAAFATAPYEQASPTLLAQQPVGPPRVVQDKMDEDWSAIFEHLENRLQALRNWRYSWWAFWSVLAAFFLPFRYVWLVVANRMWRGSNINNQIINSHGVLAVRTCAAGLWTGLCAPSRPWFKMGAALPWVKLDQDAIQWLKDLEDKVYTILAQSNFYTRMSQAFNDETVFGTAPIICYEDFEDVVRFYGPCAGEYYLGVGARFAPDTLYREFTLTILQIVDWWQYDNCPREIQQLWTGGNYDKEYVVAHAIEPNFPISKKGDRAGSKILIVPQFFAYREVYWLKGTKTERPLSRRGFRKIPFMALRWATVSNDAYGRSPCMDGIGDNKQIQVQDVRKGELLEKGVRPPMGANPELKNEPASIMPGMITYTTTTDGKKGFWPLFEPNPAWLTGLTADITKVEARIDHCLFVDLFMAITRMEGVQPRNELELTKRDLERLQELGPVIDLAEKELDVCIERVVDILSRRMMRGADGKLQPVLKPPPPSLAGIPLKITYVSILRLAQRSAESVAMKDGLQTGGFMSSAAKAAGLRDPLRVVNLEEAYRHYLEINNFPQNCMYTDEQVKQQDQARAKAMQQAQQPGQMQAMVDAAKTLSQTQVGGGNALEGLLGAQPGGAGAPPQ